MSDARTLILLNEKRGKQSEPWNSTRGIYADFADGFDKPKYYCKCPKCKFVHGFYKTPREAIVRKLCNLCRFKDVEKLKKEVHQIAFNESDEDIDPKEYADQALDWQAALKRLRFWYMHPGWHKRRRDHKWVSVEHAPGDGSTVNVLLRDTRRNETLHWEQVTPVNAVQTALRYLTMPVTESEDFDPTEEVNRLTDWEGLLRRLGFVFDPKDDTWRLEYTFQDPSKVKRRYQMEITPNTPGYVGIEVSQWRGQAYWRTGGTDWVDTLELRDYFRRHYPWLLKKLGEGLSDRLVSHLLA